ncbi:MAG: hypothetical protein WC624_04335 [Candidatus Margulisiibacteriota bacterium]
MPQLIEPLQFLKEIHEKGVRYLLIGRQAVIAYGGPVQSMDYDIFIDGSEDNTKVLLSIAEKYDLIPNLAKDKIKSHFKFRLENDFIVDVFRARSLSLGKGKKITFEDIYSRRNVLKGASGLELNLPSIEDLISLKKLRSSPKDLLDIQYLQAIKNK